MYREGMIAVFMALLMIKMNAREEGTKWSYLG